VTKGEVLDYPDGALDRVPFLDVVGDLVGRIRRIRPQVVMTFGADGGVTAHRDHSMVALFTTAACQWAGRTDRFKDQLEKEGLQPHQVKKLYLSTSAFTLAERQPILPAPATAIIDIGPYVDTKIAAFKTHTSQSPLFPIFEHIVRQRLSKERFILFGKSEPSEMLIEDDLFAGISASD